MDSLTVNVVTPNGLVYDHHAKIVVAKTTDGEIGILPKHAPIIVPLAIDGSPHQTDRFRYTC